METDIMSFSQQQETVYSKTHLDGLVKDPRRIKIREKLHIPNLETTIGNFGFRLYDCACQNVRSGDVTLHGLTHHSPFNETLLRQMISARVNTEADQIGPLITNLIDKKKWNLTSYSAYIQNEGNPIDEVGLILAAITIHKHIGVMLRGFTWWTTRNDNNWQKCDVLFAYAGKMRFVLIEKIDIKLLNSTADKVPLRGVSRQGRKRKQANILSEESPSKRPRGRPRKIPPQLQDKPTRKIKKRESKTKGRKLLKIVLGSRKRSPKKKSPNMCSPIKRRGKGANAKPAGKNSKRKIDFDDCKSSKKKKAICEKENVGEVGEETPITRNDVKGSPNITVTETRGFTVDDTQRHITVGETVSISVNDSVGQEIGHIKKKDDVVNETTIDTVLESGGVVVDETEKKDNVTDDNPVVDKKGNDETVPQTGLVTVNETSVEENDKITYGDAVVNNEGKNTVTETGLVKRDETSSEEKDMVKDSNAVVKNNGKDDRNPKSGLVTVDQTGVDENGNKTNPDGAVTVDDGNANRGVTIESDIDTDHDDAHRRSDDDSEGEGTEDYDSGACSRGSRCSRKSSSGKSRPTSCYSSESSSSDSEEGSTSRLRSKNRKGSRSRSRSKSPGENKSSKGNNTKDTKRGRKRKREKNKKEKCTRSRKDYGSVPSRRSNRIRGEKPETQKSESEENSDDVKKGGVSQSTSVEWQKELEIEYGETVVDKTTKKKKTTVHMVVKSFVLKRKKQRRYRCTNGKCDEEFDSIKLRTQHIKDKHGLVLKVCKKCGKRCETKWGYKKHMALHARVRGKYCCEEAGCGKTFTHSSYLKRHMTTHMDNIMKYECPAEECMKAGRGKYKQRSDYVRHLEMHKGNSFLCSVCGKKFATKKRVYDHKFRVHRPVIECKNKARTGCEYTTKEPKLMKKHAIQCK